MAWLIPISLLLALAGLIVWRIFMGKREPGYLAICEYWVYVDKTRLPDQTALMERMISSNPHNRPGRPSIGAREGMLFTDIRLHLAVALKEKNHTVFRPDLFELGVEPTAESLAGLSRANALAKVRYASEARLGDTRHLQFLPHMADSLSDLMGGLVVFDHVMERMWTADDFREILVKNNNAERPDFHIRVDWVVEADACYARTFGMRKLGWSELRTVDQERDHEVLVTGLMLRLTQQIFRKPEERGPFEFEDFGDSFIIELGEEEDGFQRVHIKRHSH